LASYIYGLPAHDITRDFFFNVGDGYGILRWVLLFLIITSFAYLIHLLKRKGNDWAKGEKGVFPGFSRRRAARVIREILLHKKILKEWHSGLPHAFVFFGILGTGLTYMILFVQEFCVTPFTGSVFLSGYYYLVWSFASDFFSFMILVGLILSLFRRIFICPTSLVTTRTDYLVIILLLIAVLSGFFHNAFRIAICDYPSFEIFSPVSFLFSKLIFSSSEKLLSTMHGFVWWINVVSSLAFFAMAGSSTLLGHITVSSLNIYFSSLRDEDVDTKYRISLDTEEQSKRAIRGTIRVEDYSWKDLMDLDACMKCGRCQDRCPAYLAGKPLSPKKLISDLLQCFKEYRLSKSVKTRGGEIPSHIKKESVWSCLLCGECVEICPARINHMKKIIGIRKAYISLDEIPDGVKALRDIDSEKISSLNPRKHFWISRVEGLKTISEKPDAEYLFYAGCKVDQDENAAEDAVAFLSLMIKAGVSVAVIGAEEVCCGNTALRAGDEIKFRALALKNLSLITRYNAKKIITICPHGFNLFNKEYRTLARSFCTSYISDYKVYHHTQILSTLISEGKISPEPKNGVIVTFHDPCLLGRYNNEYNAPRSIINSVPGVMNIEMNRTREESFCCGAPLELMGNSGLEIAEFRARDIHSSGAKIALTACPHCASMLRKGMKSASINSVQICDIASFFASSSEKEYG
jgi:Fe-S oxidoreductase/nitrate reductase gamma subunit